MGRTNGDSAVGSKDFTEAKVEPPESYVSGREPVQALDMSMKVLWCVGHVNSLDMGVSNNNGDGGGGDGDGDGDGGDDRCEGNTPKQCWAGAGDWRDKRNHAWSCRSSTHVT